MLALKRKHCLAAALLWLSVGAVCGATGSAAKQLRAGMIGLDTSHVVAFTRLFNDAPAGSELAGIKVVAGYPGGTDYSASRNRVRKLTEQVRGMGVEIVDTIPALLEKVDVVLLESVDGRIHLAEAIPVFKARKPVFIDKPVAGSLADAIAIYDLARKYQVPCFSTSSVRYSTGIQELKRNEQLGEIKGAETWFPCHYQQGTPDLFFYGVHGVEALFALMGTGCETVARVQAADADVVTGVWKGGRVGTFRGLRRNKAVFGAVAFGTKGIAHTGTEGGYDELCREIARFFRTGKPPVSSDETLEIFAFMEAADESKRQNGAPVSVEAVMARARQSLLPPSL